MRCRKAGPTANTESKTLADADPLRLGPLLSRALRRVLVRLLAPGAPQRGGLHEQALQRDRLAAIHAVAVARGVQALQGGRDLGRFVEVAPRLRAVDVRELLLRRFVLAVDHLVRAGIGRFAPRQLGSANLRAQFRQSVAKNLSVNKTALRRGQIGSADYDRCASIDCRRRADAQD